MKIARESYGTQFLAYFRSRLKIPTIDYDAWIYALRAALRRLSCTVHFVFAKSYWFTLGFKELLYRWRRAPKRTNISEKHCSHSRSIGRRCGEFHAGKRIRARASAFYLPTSALLRCDYPSLLVREQAVTALRLLPLLLAPGTGSPGSICNLFYPVIFL